MILELCKGVHCVDLGESFQTHIYLQNLASIQPRTSPLKFAGDPGGHELGPRIHYSFAWYRAAARAGGKDDRAAQAATTHAAKRALPPKHSLSVAVSGGDSEHAAELGLISSERGVVG